MSNKFSKELLKIKEILGLNNFLKASDWNDQLSLHQIGKKNLLYNMMCAMLKIFDILYFMSLA